VHALAGDTRGAALYKATALVLVDLARATGTHEQNLIDLEHVLTS